MYYSKFSTLYKVIYTFNKFNLKMRIDWMIFSINPQNEDWWWFFSKSNEGNKAVEARNFEKNHVWEQKAWVKNFTLYHLILKNPRKETCLKY